MFAISWRNPGAELRDTSLDDYRAQGVMAAIDAMQDDLWRCEDPRHRLLPRWHVADDRRGRMARDGDDRLASADPVRAQTDFTEAGELQLFITDGPARLP